MIAFKDTYKIAFIIDWGTFILVVMPFRLNNAPQTYQWAVCTSLNDYLGMFVKLFLDDFNVFNNLDAYLPKL
jgi:hypothetical protein